ncbi:protein NirF [Thiogranum longum]|uniref:Protein NirF n=1 Tax=Thiogranum longum TaxID=1537524 RepID=A0A4R1HK41_9GAMM|nr:cytochrome D1 domain-containing protein [Thiogranum longum]TCK17602.1 protein NirF [Thiogranum longum]
MRSLLATLLAFSLAGSALAGDLRGTGDLGVVVERANGKLLVVEHTGDTRLSEIEGLGDLSHASVVFSRDERYAYVFGRDGGLTKVDLLKGRIVKRVMQSGNSIGGAISQDGKWVAVSNYKPGGVRIFDATTLEMVADIPAEYTPGKLSKTVGLVDAPGNRFVFSLYDGDQIWLVDMKDPHKPAITRFEHIGRAPYDALITPDGRYYIAGLFGEDSMALLDLWHPENGVRKILKGYAEHDEKLPVYKMPHLEGWAVAGSKAFVPAVGQHKVLVIDTADWTILDEIDVHGQPVFVMARPDGRQVWVNFAHPDNDTVQVIDAESQHIIKTLKPGKAVLHMEFTPRGEKLWLSVRDDNRVQVYDTATMTLLKELPAEKPSGIFFTDRAHRTGL